jgi:hypothetical protein
VLEFVVAGEFNQQFADRGFAEAMEMLSQVVKARAAS